MRCNVNYFYCKCSVTIEREKKLRAVMLIIFTVNVVLQSSPNISENSDDTPQVCHDTNIIIKAGDSEANGVLAIFDEKLFVLTVAHTFVDKPKGCMKDSKTISLFYLGVKLQWVSIHHMVAFRDQQPNYSDNRKLDACVILLHDDVKTILGKIASAVDFSYHMKNWDIYCSEARSFGGGKKVYCVSRFSSSSGSPSAEFTKGNIKKIAPPIGLYDGKVPQGVSGSGFFSFRSHELKTVHLLMGIVSSCDDYHDSDVTILIMTPFYLNILLSIRKLAFENKPADWIRLYDYPNRIFDIINPSITASDEGAETQSSVSNAPAGKRVKLMRTVEGCVEL